MLALFEQQRPDDINVCCAVGSERGSATYTRFNHPGINSLDPTHVAWHAAHPAYEVMGTEEVEVVRLSDLLAQRLPPGAAVDLLNVDAEGSDLDVLRSNDWERWRPGIVVVEDHQRRFGADAPSEIADHLAGLGYHLQSHLVVTSIYTSEPARLVG
jgi:FkbM family methyltransferase